MSETNPTSPALYLLGGIELRNIPEGDANRLLGQQKVVGFLAYLALSPPGRFQRRDRIVGLLWPELDQSHARGALRKVVFAVREVLGDKALAARGDEELMLAHQHLWCDASAFIDAVAQGHYAVALRLYRGDLMPGFHLPDCAEYDTWLAERQSYVLDQASATAWAMAILKEEGGEHTEAGGYARTAARYVWSNERVLRKAMQLLIRTGDRAGALRLFDEFARRLKQELDTEPSPETLELAAKIRQ